MSMTMYVRITIEVLQHQKSKHSGIMSTDSKIKWLIGLLLSYYRLISTFYQIFNLIQTHKEIYTLLKS